MTFNTSSRRRVSTFLIIALLFAAFAPGTGFAGMIGTDEIIEHQSAELDRDRLKQELQREDIRGELERLGVNPDEAMDRVAALTDAEVQELTAGLDHHPAGAGVSVTALLLIIIIILLLR